MKVHPEDGVAHIDVIVYLKGYLAARAGGGSRAPDGGVAVFPGAVREDFPPIVSTAVPGESAPLPSAPVAEPSHW